MNNSMNNTVSNTNTSNPGINTGTPMNVSVIPATRRSVQNGGQLGLPRAGDVKKSLARANGMHLSGVVKAADGVQPRVVGIGDLLENQLLQRRIAEGVAQIGGGDEEAALGGSLFI